MSEHSTTGGETAKEVTGRTVFVCLVAFFGVIALVNAIMIGAAVSTFGGVETASAYQAGLAFAHESATVRAQDDLHWQVTAELKRADNGVPRIDVTVRDVSGNLVTDLSASARLSHPADRRSDQPVALDEIGPGQFAGITASPVGQWDLVLEFTRNGERVFRSRNRIFIP
jgi:nitrogen fixation protein FixH